MKKYGKTIVRELPLKELHTTYKDHRRLTVFHNKGTVCICCFAGREGVRLILNTSDNGKATHVDVFTKNWVLMTVDHTISKAEAKALGWTKDEIEALSNKEPMCARCNEKKSNKSITVNELRELLGIKQPLMAGVLA